MTNSSCSTLSLVRFFPDNESLILDLIASSAEIEHLVLNSDVPAGFPDRFEAAISENSSIRYLTVSKSTNKYNCNARLFQAAAFAIMSPRLEQLDISCTFLAEGALKMAKAFERCTALTSLAILLCTIANKESISALAAGISSLRALESLEFLFNDTRDLNTEPLAEAIASLPELRVLKLVGQSVAIIIMHNGGSGIRSLAGAKRLRTLTIGNSKLTEGDVATIFEGLTCRNCAMRELSLCGLYLKDTELAKLAPWIRQAPSLHSLNISNNGVDAKTAEALGRAIGRSGLTRLDISGCKMPARDVIAMFRVMHGCRLVSLSMSNNFCEGEAALTVTEFLCAVPGRLALEELNMGYCKLTSEAMSKELVKVVSRAPSLHVLNLAGNNIGADAAATIMDALSAVSTNMMEKIDLYDCCIQNYGAEAVGRLIVSRGCREIVLGNNKIFSCGIVAIANAVRLATTGRIGLLSLGNNYADDEAIDLLVAKVIAPGRVVGNLSINGIDIGEECAKTIVRALREGEDKGVFRILCVSGSRCKGGASKILKEEEAREASLHSVQLLIADNE